MECINPFIHIAEQEHIPLVDSWVPNPEDVIFKHTKGAMILPVSDFYGVEPSANFDCFVLSTKRCYNSDEVRNHCSLYLNYFEKYFDPEHELLMIYYRLKYYIDYVPNYDKRTFISDLNRLMFSPNMLAKVRNMNNANYSLNLTYKNKNNPGLQYTDRHGAILMEISLLMNMVIPLSTHYIYVNRIQTVKDFLLEVYDNIFSLYPDVDIYSKLYETAISNVNHSADKNSVLWAMQGIRTINPTTHSLSTVENIILQIIPKYSYDKNIICFNYESIMRNIKYQVKRIA